MNAILGLELRIVRVVAKRKLSQNLKSGDSGGVLAELGEGSLRKRAAAMEGSGS